MSLINDVLRDLENRQAGVEAGAAPAPARLHVKTRPGGKSVWPWLLIAAIAAGIVLHFALRAQPPANVGPALYASAQPAAESAAPEPHDVQSELPTPGESVDPGSTDPVDTPSQPQLAALSTEPRLPAATEADRPEPAERLSAATAHAQAETPPAAEPDRQIEPAPSTGHIEIRRAVQVEPDDLLAAQRALSRGQTSLAESLLHTLLEQQPEAQEARVLLARVLIQQNRDAAAVSLLEDGLNWPDSSAVTTLLARLFMDRGQLLRARELLQQQVPDVADDPDYHLLMAAVQRELGEHQQALASYRALTDRVPQRAAAWVGLGSTLESLDRPLEARAAYERALDTGDRGAAAFARSRLLALPETSGETP